MRKYFLLSAVALMAATSANATTDYAEVTAKATIEVATKHSCSNLDFGTLVLKQGNKAFNYGHAGPSWDASTSHEDLISASGISFSCELPVGFGGQEEYKGIILKNKNSDELMLNLIVSNSGEFFYSAALEIPAEVKAGEYTGSFIMTEIH
ncbi:MAG: hypothetical protein IJF12_01340 [Alphaproteobacteria bacterium]|nr:hypothetical protein [Alphaproteobacteria bacterium]